MAFSTFTASLLLALGSCASLAQQTFPASAGSAGPIRLDVVVTAGDRGKPVAGLGQNSFTVLDNGAPQRIQSFRALTGQADPVKVLLVIDAVNTDYERVAYERERLDTFLKANGGKLAQPTALAIFTDSGTQIQPGYSTDGNALSQLLDKQVIGLRELRRSAGFYGAEERLDLSLKTLNQLVSRAQSEPGRKFIIFLTPGWPLLSGPSVQFTSKQEEGLFQQVVSMSTALRQANATLYAVDPLGAGEGPGRTFYFEEYLKGVTKPSQVMPADLGAQVLAVQSGGLFLSSNNDIEVLIQKAYDDAAAEYEITYDPPPADRPNQYHKVEVRVAEPHLVARTRQGYYSQP